jgi:hypothetical protein
MMSLAGLVDRAPGRQLRTGDSVDHNTSMALRILSILLLSLLPLTDTAAVEDAIEAPSGYESSGKPMLIPAQSRGQILYENHCLVCHESTVHIRQCHKVRTMNDLRAWVTLWAGELHLDWGSPEAEEVVRHLNRRYYRFEER